MSSGLGGVAFGMLALGALDAAVNSAAAGARVGGLADVVSIGFERLISPAVPAIPVHGQNSHPYQQAQPGPGQVHQRTVPGTRPASVRPQVPPTPGRSTTVSI